MYRILSIDGGGIKGVFPAAFLAALEDYINDKVSNYFDLIAGTSTGGIIALGLGLGFSSKEILNFYEQLGREVFSGKKFMRFLRQFVFSRYDATPLKISLEKIFGNKKLGDSTKRLIIPAVNLENGSLYIYKTAHHPRFQTDYKIPAVDVSIATAAAPTYFPIFRASSGIPLVDGGLWANNPTGFAVVEAIGVLNWPRDSIKVLSIGCTSAPLNMSLDRKRSSGSLYWGTRIPTVFLTTQSFASIGIAQILIGNENIYRYNPVVPDRRFSLDRVDGIRSLKGLGYAEARKAVPVLKKIFLSQQVDQFVPYQ